MIDIKNTQRRFGKSFASAMIGIEAMRLMNEEPWMREYAKKKRMKFNKLKGGNNIMETKSRYEVIAELEEKKRNLIINRDNLPGELQEKQRELKNLKREIEDKEEEIREFKEAMKTQEKTINELIKSTDDSLNRFADIGNKKS